ncbi:hypothetical protein AB8O64_27640 [Streptomyces sp. QH1-20]|uniref:hypothetical protein n=1 Tax=Streptomyces sp. QH1-20 TaxID=3240934 RepID=UPI0035118087
MHPLAAKLALAAGAIVVGEVIKAGVELAEGAGKEVPGWLGRLPEQIEEHTPMVADALVKKGPDLRKAWDSTQASE